MSVELFQVDFHSFSHCKITRVKVDRVVGTSVCIKGRMYRKNSQYRGFFHSHGEAWEAIKEYREALIAVATKRLNELRTLGLEELRDNRYEPSKND